MKLFNEFPVYNDTPEEMCEKHNITKLVEYERFLLFKHQILSINVFRTHW